MRKLLFVSILALSVTVACNQPKGEKTEAGDAQNVDSSAMSQAETLNVNLTTSTVEWLGVKPTGQHNGTVNITEGSVSVKGSELVGGSFSIDLKSIKVLDLTDTKMNAKLTGHLNSADFFDTENHPVAKFEITGVAPFTGTLTQETTVKPTHTITGNLTMRGTTKSISFPAQVTVSGTSVSAVTPQFLVDRTQWGVNFKSKTIDAKFKDDFINDEIGLTIKLEASK